MTTQQVRRKRLTQGQREKILQDYARSGLAQRPFALQAGVGLSTLQFWLRNAARRASAAKPRLIQVPNLLGWAPSSPAYRLHLAGGMQLEVSSGFKAEELSALLRALRGL